MKERITFVQKEGDSIEPTALKVDGSGLSGPNVKAVREDRLTLALDELPSELKALLEGVNQLHIRWVDRGAHEAVSPLLARLPPGFHLFYTPGSDTSINPCPLLTKVFGLNSCSSPAESFTTLPTDRFTHSTTHQFYQPLSSLDAYIHFAKSQLCTSNSPKSCSSRLNSLHHASHLDISYDAISRTIRITSLWPYSHHSLSASLLSPSIRTEIGIISTASPKTLEPHEIGISGLLTVLGQSKQPSPTLFSFPSRHRDAATSFSSKFLSPTGLHPTLQLSITSPTPPKKSPNPETCRLHAYFILPKTVFPDKYQLSDPLFLASKNLTALRYITPGIDLEAPEYVTPTWGSSLLLELSPPSTSHGAWTAEVPLHLRYLAPSMTGYRSAEVPYPALFWACTAEEGTKFPTNPFEKDKVGYDGLFGERTVFWHLNPTSKDGMLINTVRVPVLNLQKADWVNLGTAAAVVLGFSWVVLKLLGVAFGGRKVNDEKKKQ